MNRWYEVDHYRIEPDDLIEPLAEELVDLGYSEGQGVKMLDAVFPEGAA